MKNLRYVTRAVDIILTTRKNAALKQRKIIKILTFFIVFNQTNKTLSFVKFNVTTRPELCEVG